MHGSKDWSEIKYPGTLTSFVNDSKERIATMAAIRGTTSQTYFAPKPIFFLNFVSITHHKLNKRVFDYFFSHTPQSFTTIRATKNAAEKLEHQYRYTL
jgi:hypothetical protein